MNLFYLTILLPLIGFLLLAFSRGRWSENVSATIGVGSIGLAALVTVMWLDFFAQKATGVQLFDAEPVELDDRR
jgi:NADH-quinone oxidoreductase subunit L